MFLLKKINKKITKLFIKFKERTFKANDTRLKYLLFNGIRGNDILVVIFSAYSKDAALYNYVRTLSGFHNVTRLYIKDDFGPNKTGSYYLGEKGNHNVEPSVVDLINHIKKKMLVRGGRI